jgi:predicted PurR-regulated permease PerM
MQFILYTLAALLLYGISDYILNTIEIRLQKRLPNRSLVFFVIISILAVSSFSVISMIYKGEDSIQTGNNAQSMDMPANTKHLQPQPAQKK